MRTRRPAGGRFLDGAAHPQHLARRAASTPGRRTGHDSPGARACCRWAGTRRTGGRGARAEERQQYRVAVTAPIDLEMVVVIQPA